MSIKIAVHTVAKNEIENVAEWVNHALEADEILLLDTGSTDGTLEIARSLTDKYSQLSLYQATIRPWRFDVARNTALSLVRSDIDVVVTVDLDERLKPGWRQAIESVWQVGVHSMGSYRYIFATDKNGRPTLEFNQTRIHSRFNYHWRLPAHEAPYSYLLGQEAFVFIPGMEVWQKQNHTKVNRMERDLELTRLGYQENPNDPRAVFYYGRQCQYAGRWDEAIELLTRYFAMGKTFPWEAAAAAESLAAAWRGKERG